MQWPLAQRLRVSTPSNTTLAFLLAGSMIALLLLKCMIMYFRDTFQGNAHDYSAFIYSGLGSLLGNKY